MKLNQVNALVKGRKSETEKSVTETYKVIQKHELFDGRQRHYQPKDEEGDRLPSEVQKVQYKVSDMLRNATDRWADLWDLIATQDAGNQTAKADIEVSVPGTDTKKTVAIDVPITTLLFLEKQVNDLETFLSKLPVPETTREWIFDPQTDLLKSTSVQTTRMKKVPKTIVKYEATKEHPAQVEMFMEDIMAGTWTETQFSGRISSQQKNELLTRVKALKDGVKLAREKANSIDVHPKKIARSLLEFVLLGQIQYRDIGSTVLKQR